MEAAPLTLTPRRTRLVERFGVAYFDGWLMAAALGLVGFSVFTLAVATPDAVQGQPLYFAMRQTLYALVGLALMLAVAKIDYSRFREIRVGLYSLMIASICVVFVFGTAVRGSPFVASRLDRYSRPFLMSATDRVVWGRSGT